MRSGSCPRQQTPLPEPSRSMWRAILTLLPIAPALILLPAIAFASPQTPHGSPESTMALTATTS